MSDAYALIQASPALLAIYVVALSSIAVFDNTLLFHFKCCHNGSSLTLQSDPALQPSLQLATLYQPLMLPHNATSTP